jgi:hypothetical protein
LGFVYKLRNIVKNEFRQLASKIVIERFKVIISVIFGWKLNGYNMLFSAALCGLSLGLVSVGVQAAKVIFHSLRTYYFYIL